MTKKEFKEQVDIHVYGSGKRRRVRLYFDYKHGYGYLKMLKGYGCTQAQILKDAYDILVNQNLRELCWYEFHNGEVDFDRIKPQVVG